MAHIPYRTGLKSIRALLRKVCSLINKFRHLFDLFMTEEQKDRFDELYTLCEEIISIIDELFTPHTP